VDTRRRLLDRRWPAPGSTVTPRRQKEHIVATILWIIAVIIGIFGVLRLIRGDILVGIVLIVVAFLVGPGGVSIFT
jgi:TM2 domain-containing membrane protein YozV